MLSEKWLKRRKPAIGTRIQVYYPGGVTVTQKIMEYWENAEGRLFRRVQTERVNFDTPAKSDAASEALKRSWNATIGREYIERYTPASHGMPAEWHNVPHGL